MISKESWFLFGYIAHRLTCFATAYPCPPTLQQIRQFTGWEKEKIRQCIDELVEAKILEYKHIYYNGYTISTENGTDYQEPRNYGYRYTIPEKLPDTIDGKIASTLINLSEVDETIDFDRFMKREQQKYEGREKAWNNIKKNKLTYIDDELNRTVHELKIKENYYYAVKFGRKTFELRKDDRDYQEGELIRFHVISNWDGKERFVAREFYEVTYKLWDCRQYGLEDGYCILGIKRFKRSRKLRKE